MFLTAPTLSTELRGEVTVIPANLPVMGNAEPHPSAATQMLASIREDTTRLSRILCYLNCDAAIRGIDGCTLLTIARWGARRPEADPCNVEHPPALCAPIYDSHGRLLASLGLMAVEMDRSGTLTKLLRALIESAAHAITERLFRMSYRRCWIIAAQPQNARGVSMLLAVDRGRRVMGADRSAREFLEATGHPFGSACSLSTFFKLDETVFRESGGDAVHRLLGCDDGMPYSVLVTPPDRTPLESNHEERALLHARPRMDMIGDLDTNASREAPISGLAPRVIRRIQHYINTHLESTLNVEELADHVGLSASYFSRAFVRSVGTTPHDYVVRRRVLRAQQLLAETDLNLAEIAFTAGFADQSHFSRRFRQLVGLPPRAFRNRHR
jgi:AraC-like DNA-binding protein